MGINQCNPFNTSSKTEFEKKLKFMTRSDMTEMSYRLGITPEQSEAAIKRQLSREFDSYVRKSAAKKPTGRKPIVDVKSKKYAELKKLLSV